MKLTESQLNRIVEEVVDELLTEGFEGMTRRDLEAWEKKQKGGATRRDFLKKLGKWGAFGLGAVGIGGGIGILAKGHPVQKTKNVPTSTKISPTISPSTPMPEPPAASHTKPSQVPIDKSKLLAKAVQIPPNKRGAGPEGETIYRAFVKSFSSEGILVKIKATYRHMELTYRNPNAGRVAGNDWAYGDKWEWREKNLDIGDDEWANREILIVNYPNQESLTVGDLLPKIKCAAIGKTQINGITIRVYTVL